MARERGIVLQQYSISVGKENTLENIGVVGLGRMGSAIAQRMSQQEIAVQAWTQSGRSVDGVESAPDLKTLASRSDTLILSLFGNEAVGEVLDTLLTTDLMGKQIIDTSTVTPDLLVTRLDRFSQLGADIVDAPISGGPELVRAGSCGIFVGGEAASFERARDTLAPLSQRILHVGPLGTGLAMKAINNGMIQAYFAGLYDLMPLANKAGLPLETALRILCGGPAGMPLVADRISKVLGEDEEVGFALSAAFKDNQVFRQMMASFGLESSMLKNFGELKKPVAEAGLLEADPAALVSLGYKKGKNT